ncbi:hypothetical protein HJC99_00105 [Candidatus Saccharibacteria bacterium]|nr:hypothetical protein [Candidatus Saccharibacteria bacterium]
MDARPGVFFRLYFRHHTACRVALVATVVFAILFGLIWPFWIGIDDVPSYMITLVMLGICIALVLVVWIFITEQEWRHNPEERPPDVSPEMIASAYLDWRIFKHRWQPAVVLTLVSATFTAALGLVFGSAESQASKTYAYMVVWYLNWGLAVSFLILIPLGTVVLVEGLPRLARSLGSMQSDYRRATAVVLPNKPTYPSLEAYAKDNERRCAVPVNHPDWAVQLNEDERTMFDDIKNRLNKPA